MSYHKLLILNILLFSTAALLNPACAGKKHKGSPAVVEVHGDDYEGYMVRPFYAGKALKLPADFPSKPDVSTVPYIDAAPDKIVESILDHTYVTHPWLRDRFRKILNATPPQVLRMAQCTRVILLDATAPEASTAGGFVTLAGSAFAINEGEFATSGMGRSSSGTSSDRNFYWTYLSSRVLAQVDAAAKDAEHRAMIRGIMQLTHEFIHDCDEKLETKGVKPSQNLGNYGSEVVRDYFLWGYYGIPKAKANVDSHSFEEMGAIHMASMAADAYADFSSLEQYAVLGEHMLSYKLLGVEYFEFFAEMPGADGDKFASKMLWGVKNKLCSPQVWAQARSVVTSLKLFDDIDIPETPDCQPQLLPTGVTVTESLLSTIGTEPKFGI